MDGTLFALGLLSAVSVFVIMWRINLRRFMGYPVLCDITVCASLAWIFHGSFAGMAAAILAALFFTIFISIYRWAFGYEKWLGKRGWIRFKGKWA